MHELDEVWQAPPVADQKRGCLRLCSGALPGVSASRRDRWSWNAGVTHAPLLAWEGKQKKERFNCGLPSLPMY